MGRRNYIDIDWPELLELIDGLDQEKLNRIRINREVIPIIFVPGIMGSRLKNKNSGERVWDPDREIMCMLMKYGGAWNSPAQRKRMLIGERFEPEYLVVDRDNPDHNKKFYTSEDPGRAKRGWGGVYWGSYGRFLEQLQNHDWEVPLQPSEKPGIKDLVGYCFEFPVHAFGYNWTDSNFNSGEKLAEEIDSVIWRYRKKARMCNHVILVSHSMGGLVCRSACKLHDAEKKVLGVIHGVQPATGAAAAYWRMKAGFERTGGGLLSSLNSKVSAWVLGTNGEEVTCILANSPGGLELLPNQNYRDNNGNASWLRIPAKGDEEVLLPKYGSPYAEIYKVKNTKFWRLITPEWLAPTDKLTPPESPNRDKKSQWAQYVTCLNSAEEFHNQLGDSCHNLTYQFYSCELDTADQISFSAETLKVITTYIEDSNSGSMPYIAKSENVQQQSFRGQCVMYVDDNDNEIISSDTSSATRVISMSHPNRLAGEARFGGGGDGTVSRSSGDALTGVMDSRCFDYIEHQSAFLNQEAIAYVFDSILDIAFILIKEIQGNNPNNWRKT